MDEFASRIEALEHRWMRAWMQRDRNQLKAMTARDFIFLLGSESAAILDRPSWLEAATTRFSCQSYRFDHVYARNTGTWRCLQHKFNWRRRSAIPDSKVRCGFTTSGSDQSAAANGAWSSDPFRGPITVLMSPTPFEECNSGAESRSQSPVRIRSTSCLTVGVKLFE